MIAAQPDRLRNAGAIQGAHRWIPLPFLEFQSSEFGKILLIVALAAFAVDRSRQLHERRTTARIMLLALISALLVIPQPDLGTGMVYVAVGFSVLFFAGTSFKQLTALVAMFVIAITIVLAGGSSSGRAPAQGLSGQSADGVRQPSEAGQGRADQIPGTRSSSLLIAIGSGQKTGRGKYNAPDQAGLPPRPTTPTSSSPRWGRPTDLSGAALVLSFYALLIWRTLTHSHDEPRTFSAR